MKVDYIKTGTLPKPLIHRKAPAKFTNDMTRLSTLRIVWFLAKRHQVDLLVIGVGIEFALLIITNI